MHGVATGRLESKSSKAWWATGLLTSRRGLSRSIGGWKRIRHGSCLIFFLLVLAKVEEGRSMFFCELSRQRNLNKYFPQQLRSSAVFNHFVVLSILYRVFRSMALESQ